MNLEFAQLVEQKEGHKEEEIKDNLWSSINNITRTEENPVSNIRVTDPLLSDHEVVTFSFDTQSPPLPQKEITYRQLGKINMVDFQRNIENDKILNGEDIASLTNSTKCTLTFKFQ